MRRHIVPIIRFLGYPGISYCQMQGGIRVGQHRYPLVGVNRGRIVEVRGNKDLFYTGVLFGAYELILILVREKESALITQAIAQGGKERKFFD